MVQAARSGKQNIAEASVDSGTSKKIELKLVGIARGSLEELLQDYEDYLRQNNLPLWPPEDLLVKKVRSLCYVPNKSYTTYMSYMGSPEGAANTLICLIHQANYLLDRQLNTLQNDFLENGGFTERLYKMRKEHNEK
jgi:four helix bundle suffix protein